MNARTYTHHARHVVSTEFYLNREADYAQSEQYLCAKPEGFWLSIDDDWRRYCEVDQYGWPNLNAPVCFDVDESKILVISCIEEIDAFHEQFAAERYSKLAPDWAAVAKEYSGIAIAPYLWERRMDGPVSDWYYTWDAASACIWDLSAIGQKEG